MTSDPPHAVHFSGFGMYLLNWGSTRAPEAAGEASTKGYVYMPKSTGTPAAVRGEPTTSTQTNKSRIFNKTPFFYLYSGLTQTPFPQHEPVGGGDSAVRIRRGCSCSCNPRGEIRKE